MDQMAGARGSRPMRRYFGAAGVLLTVTMLAAACSSTTKSPAVPAAADTSATVVVGSSVAPPTLDLTSNPAAAIDEVLDYNVYQHLAELNPKGQIVPVLATSWSVSASGTTYTFHLRPGVKFSNGDPLTAADVVYSIDRVISPSSSYPYKALWVGVVKSATAVGTSEVQVTLDARDQEWLYTLAAYSNGVILDPSAVSTIATHPVGTGPLMFSSFVPNYSVTLVRNPSYWGPKAKVAGVEFRYFSNADAENAALQSGQIQVIDSEPTPQDVATFKANPSYQVDIGPTSGKVQLTLNNTYGPLKSKLVRQAISYAVSKKVIDNATAGGYGTLIGSDSVPGDPYFLPKLANLYPYDPAKAKKLLAEAGYPHGFSLTLVLPPYSYATIGGPIVAAELKKVGIDVTVSDIQWSLWLSQVFESGDFAMTIIDQAEARDIANYANPKYYWHYAHTSTIQSLLTEGDQSSTQAGFVKYYEQAETMIAHDAVNDWWYNLPELTIAKKDIIGLPKGSLSESYQIFNVQVGGKLPASEASQGFVS